MSANMLESDAAPAATPNLKTDPSIVALRPALDKLRAITKGFVIKTAEGYAHAAELLKGIKTHLATIEAARTKITVPLNAALKETNAQAKAAADAFLKDEALIKAAMVAYSDEQDRIREEEQKRENERAEKERLRLQAIADEATRKANEAAEAKRAEADRLAQEGRDAEAAKLRTQADAVVARAETKAETFNDRASMVVTGVATQAAPRVGGISVPKVWAFRIQDESLIPREYLVVDEKKIRKVVQALQGGAKIPGVEVYQEKRVAAGKA